MGQGALHGDNEAAGCGIGTPIHPVPGDPDRVHPGEAVAVCVPLDWVALGEQRSFARSQDAVGQFDGVY